MSAGAIPPSFNLDLLQDLHAAVTQGVKSEHHQFFSVEFVSASKQLKWERTHRFDRFRRLNTIIKATSSGDGAAEEGGGLVFVPSIEFPEHHRTGAASRVKWLGMSLWDGAKAQEERRKQLELWINNILSNVSSLPPAVKGDLADFMQSREPSPPEVVIRSSAVRNSESSPYLASNHKRSASSASLPTEAPVKSDALTDLFLAASSYLTEKVAPDQTRMQTGVTCVSRTGNVVSSSICTTMIWDILTAAALQVGDLYPFLIAIAAISSLLCSSESCAGFHTRHTLAFQFLFASSTTFLVLRWRQRFERVCASKRSAGGHNAVQIRLQDFCNDSSILYSTEPSTVSSSRRRFGSGFSVDSEGAALSPTRKASKSRSASVVSRNLSASTFDKFDFDDISAEAKTHYWDTGSSHHFQLRGLTYLDDNCKEHPGPALCKLMLMELYEVEPQDGDRHDHVCSKGLAKKRIEAISSLPGNPFIYVINFQIPGDPPVSMVAYFALPPNVKDRYPGPATDKFLKLFHKFAKVGTEEERLAAWKAEGADISCPPGTGRDNNTSSGGSSWLKVPADIQWPSPHEPGAYPQSDFRNQRFKLVANITDGPWVVKAAVPAKPALLGKKVVARYFGGDNYIETDIHVGSSLMAAQITSLCRGFVKQFGADLAIVIQGEDESELPEKVVGCLHIHKIDLALRRKLYEDDDEDEMEE